MMGAVYMWVGADERQSVSHDLLRAREDGQLTPCVPPDMESEAKRTHSCSICGSCRLEVLPITPRVYRG